MREGWTASRACVVRSRTGLQRGPRPTPLSIPVPVLTPGPAPGLRAANTMALDQGAGAASRCARCKTDEGGMGELRRPMATPQIVSLAVASRVVVVLRT